VPNQENRPVKTSSERDGTDAENEKREQDMAEQLPANPTPAEEWGERPATGKGIATGGKSADETDEATGQDNSRS
jgi:hypothetical protein